MTPLGWVLTATVSSAGSRSCYQVVNSIDFACKGGRTGNLFSNAAYFRELQYSKSVKT